MHEAKGEVVSTEVDLLLASQVKKEYIVLPFDHRSLIEGRKQSLPFTGGEGGGEASLVTLFVGRSSCVNRPGTGM